MSTVNVIATTQPSVSVSNPKPTAQQTFTASQPQPSANSSSSVTISSSATTYVNYEQRIAQSQEAQNQSRAIAINDPLWGSKLAYGLAHDDSMTGSTVGGLLSPYTKATDPVIYYASGAPVTVASQAYYAKQASSYMSQVLELYNTEKAKGIAPGQLISDIYDLQAKQPAAFRAMMMWPPAAEPVSIETATNTPGTPPQYIYGDGQVVKS